MSSSSVRFLAAAMILSPFLLPPALAFSPTTRPASLPQKSSSRPVPPTSRHAATSRPLLPVRSTSRPTSRPSGRENDGFPYKPRLVTAQTKMGWFSFAFPRGYQVQIDGYPLGPMPVTYLRLEEGRHHVHLTEPKRVQEFALPVTKGKHMSLAVRWGKVGLRRVRGERSDVVIRWWKQGAKPVEEIRPPGRVCRGLRRCVELAPGETLYIRTPEDIVILPPDAALRSSRPWKRPKRPEEGSLTLSSYPQGAFWIGERFYGVTPIVELPILAGRHRLRVVNGYLGLSWAGEIAIVKGQETRAILRLQPKGGGIAIIRSKKPRQIFVDRFYRGWTPIQALALPKGSHRIEALASDGSVVERRIEVGVGTTEEIVFP